MVRVLRIRYTEACGNCKFFIGGKGEGVCRRSPPNISNSTTGVSRYPVVNAHTPACGEFSIGGELID